MNERGFSFIELLLAVALVGTVILGVVPAFLACKDANTRNEIRSTAAAVAQRAMEAQRRLDPSTLPTSGSTPIRVVREGERDYEFVVHYCVEPAWCDLDTRHLMVEVSFGPRTVLVVESVFTKLR